MSTPVQYKNLLYWIFQKIIKWTDMVKDILEQMSYWKQIYYCVSGDFTPTKSDTGELLSDILGSEWHACETLRQISITWYEKIDANMFAAIAISYSKIFRKVHY